MTNITEDYVSFETAKLLKEKGFKGDNSHFYERGKFIDFHNYWWRITPKERYESIEAPTLQMAMKWLREEYKFLITIDLGIGVYIWTITNIDEYTVVQIDAIVGTWEEICETAIKYCLENLIK